MKGTDTLSRTALEPSWLYLRRLIHGGVVHPSMPYLRSNQTKHYVAPVVHNVVMKEMGGNWGYVTRCGVHTNEGPHPSCQRVRLFYKRPPDGPQWPSVTPGKKNWGVMKTAFLSTKPLCSPGGRPSPLPPSLPKHNTPRYQIFKETDTVAAYQRFVTPQALRIKEGPGTWSQMLGFVCLLVVSSRGLCLLG